MKPKIVIVGLGRIGSELAIKLKGLWEVIGIDIDPGRVESIEKDEAYEGIIKILGDSTSSITLKRAITDQVHCLISTAKSDEINLESYGKFDFINRDELEKYQYGINIPRDGLLLANLIRDVRSSTGPDKILYELDADDNLRKGAPEHPA